METEENELTRPRKFRVDKKHQIMIEEQAIRCFMCVGVLREDAESIVRAISKGTIAHVAIIY